MGPLTKTLLEVEGLTVSYGGVRAVDGVSVRIRRGQLVGLIGPNGAGKTTMVDAISGMVRATGRVTFDGERIEALQPHVRARRGLVRTFQTLELFDDLNVRENLLVAADTSRWRSFASAPFRARVDADTEARVNDALCVVGLEEYADASLSALSLGQRKLVTIARALASKPKLVLLDEPAAGLDSHESVALGTKLRQAIDRGMTFVLVDHDMGLVLSFCDYVVVLEFGRVICAGAPAEVASDPRVIRAYLGEEHADIELAVAP